MILRNVARTLLIPATRNVGMNAFPMEILMEKHQIMPDALEEPPARLCDVFWEKTRSKVNLGNILEPCRTSKQPCVQWISDVDRFYTIMMVDLDMPHRSRPSMRCFVHWLVGNVPGSSIDDGQKIVEYVGPVPPYHSGLHRYVVLVYRQGNEISFDEKCITPKMGEPRGKFNIAAFVKKHSLFGPLGVNYFMAEHDDKVEDILTIMNLEKFKKKKKKKGY